MLPQELHINEIKRFHEEIQNLKVKIEAETDEIEKGNLCFRYFMLTEIWMEIDEFIEYKIKYKLDTLK